jgi:DNA-binding MarR family transcriptional regulator
MPPLTAGQLRDLDACLCLALRRTARIVTQRYDAALRPYGIRVTQVAVLTAAASGDGVPLARAADRLGMDRTTLLRNVRPLVRRGLVDIRRPPGHRHDELRATAKGRALLARVYPAWRRVQRAVRAQLAGPVWRRVAAGLGQLAGDADRS